MSAARDLLDALIEFYAAGDAKGDSGAVAMLASACKSLRHCGGPVNAAPRALPAAQFLSGALDRVPQSLATMVAALRAAAPQFHWRQNPNYSRDNMGAAFMAGYGYVEFAGPKAALFHADAVRVGLLLLGPGLHYPPHAHPAEEVYHPLTSGGAWRRGDEGWRSIMPGTAIHHLPMMVHETRAGAETLLALYCWIGDTTTEARLSR